jgi:hypothetical protein
MSRSNLILMLNGGLDITWIWHISYERAGFIACVLVPEVAADLGCASFSDWDGDPCEHVRNVAFTYRFSSFALATGVYCAPLIISVYDGTPL